jgi:tetratricopeptide (TPR) repeat protein
LTPQIVTTQDAAAQTYLNKKKDSSIMIIRTYGAPWALLLLAGSLVGCQNHPTDKPIHAAPLATIKPSAPSHPPEADTPTNKPNKPINKPSKPRNKPTSEASTSVTIDTPKSTPNISPPAIIENAPIAVPHIDHQKLPSTHIYNSLMQQAAQHRQQGQLTTAIHTYQQAQQLRPRTAAPYARLSEIALQQGNAKQAEQHARAGLYFAQGSTAKKGFWLLIALSLDAQGKPKDATLARYEASRLR